MPKHPLSKVFHVGFYSHGNPRSKRSDYSLEGNGLSVSQCPDDWIKIAKLGGSNLYGLTKKNPNFFMAHESGNEQAIQWCIDNDFLKPKTKYRAYMTNEEGEECYFESDRLKEAEEESEDVRVVDGYVFGEKGRAYWKQSFSSRISNSMAEDFAVIFFAEAHGYDGVWWNDDLDASRLSAPRGVIFQHKLSEWKVIELSSPEE